MKGMSTKKPPLRMNTRIIATTGFALLMLVILGFRASQAKPATQDIPTPTGTAYPGPDVINSDESGEPSTDAYPDSPPTPIVFPTIGYPAVPRPSDDVVDGTPFPNINSGNTETAGDGTNVEQDSQTEPVLGTLFLWLGFGAAFAVFISSIVGAIYYYDRQRTGNK